ncbi:MAG TPA: hypothetical protein VIO33_05550 [Burkholderiaceae bacterium]|jgi:hypothetical protein
MSKATDSTTPTGRKDQRKKLEESFEKSTATQPETFRDEANEDKTVEIPPDKTKKPIRGVDAPERPGR